MAKQNAKEVRKFLEECTKEQLVGLFMQKRLECYMAEKRVAQLEDDLNNASQVCEICQKEQENDRLKAEIEAECEEHQKAMRVADNTIKVLEKALELACANHPATCNVDANCNNEVDCVECLVEHYKAQAIKDLCGVKNE